MFLGILIHFLSLLHSCCVSSAGLGLLFSEFPVWNASALMLVWLPEEACETFARGGAAAAMLSALKVKAGPQVLLQLMGQPLGLYFLQLAPCCPSTSLHPGPVWAVSPVGTMSQNHEAQGQQQTDTGSSLSLVLPTLCPSFFRMPAPQTSGSAPGEATAL